MTTYTTCLSCGEILDYVGELIHPGCPVTFESAADALERDYRHALEVDDQQLVDRLADVVDLKPPFRPGVAAAAYASGYGWPVFPVIEGGKAPATRNGFKDATTDLDQIRQWWQRWPNANVGLPTGVAFDVVDIDTPKEPTTPEGLAKRDLLDGPARWAALHGGWRSYAEVQASQALPDIHGIVSTAGGGLHLYVLPTGGGNMAGVRPGIDYRGAGGFVVAPPSRRHDGAAAYLWRVRPSPLLQRSTP